LVTYSPKNCFKYSNKLKTISDAINSKAPTLASIKKEKGQEITNSLIILWLLYLNKLLDLKNPMNEEQIDLCAETILTDFYALKISDLTFIFKEIVSGKHGKFYERLAISDILNIFTNYFNERCEVAEQETLRLHNDIKSDMTFSESKNIKRILMDKK
jgi:hypothetical protein